tara:strand:- start:285 stop:407 length:123 start_codon:yes stop_codon:yes gene_type:complete
MLARIILDYWQQHDDDNDKDGDDGTTEDDELFIDRNGRCF